jgi:hypothetical protein
MSETMMRRALRAIALAVAIAAAIDPAVTARRTVKPTIVVAAVDSTRDAALANDVAKSIEKRFAVARSAIAGASAAVLVGGRLPPSGAELPTPAFVVVSDTSSPAVNVERIEAPARGSADARIPVVAHLAVHRAADRTLEVSLRVDGAQSERVARRVGPADSVLAIPLSFIAPARGANVVHVAAAIRGSNADAAADAVVDVSDRRWAILFFDPRPSWMSTFVRRTIERDTRFAVASRVLTSRNVSSSAGLPPASLSDYRSLEPFDAIVVGTPDALSTADVAGLESFMTRRGGGVVLLLDEPKRGPYDRLTGASSWSTSRGPMTLALQDHDSISLRASEIAWPSPLPAGATTIAGNERPVVWESAAGAGRLVVSGALDAWQHRDPSTSGFDRFWRAVIGDIAAASPAAVDGLASPAIAKPGEMVNVRAIVRSAALQPSDSRITRASAAATLEPGTSLRLWPDASAGHLGAAVRAPREPGSYTVTLASEGGTARIPLIVASGVNRAEASSRALSSAWAASRGGRMFDAADIGQLAAALTAAIRPPSQLVTWHPLRSAWWIVPFVLALSGEWWLRRRRGLR